MPEYKKQITHLTIVGGSSTSGKSTFIKRLKKNKLALSDFFQGTQVPDQFIDIHHTNPHLISSDEIDHLIIHYDFTNKSVLEGDYLEINSLIARSAEVRMITLVSTPKVLRVRTLARLVKVLRMHGLSFWCINYGRVRQLIKKWVIYRCPLTILQYYNNWYQFTSKLKVEQHILITDQSFSHQGYNVETIENLYKTKKPRVNRLSNYLANRG